jgi:hypothetical protein
MISTLVCGAPAGIDGSGRVRVPAERWATVLTADVAAAGGAMRADAVVALGVAVSAAQAGHTGTPFGTTTPYSTLGNHSPGRPQS